MGVQGRARRTCSAVFMETARAARPVPCAGAAAKPETAVAAVATRKARIAEALCRVWYKLRRRKKKKKGTAPLGHN